MSLTKSDLQQIGNIIDERLEKKLEQKFDENLEPIKEDIKYLRKKVDKIDKTVNVMVKMFNEDDVRLERRVAKVEKHLGLSKN